MWFWNPGAFHWAKIYHNKLFPRWSRNYVQHCWKTAPSPAVSRALFQKEVFKRRVTFVISQSHFTNFIFHQPFPTACDKETRLIGHKRQPGLNLCVSVCPHLWDQGSSRLHLFQLRRRQHLTSTYDYQYLNWLASIGWWKMFLCVFLKKEKLGQHTQRGFCSLPW